MSLSMDDRTEWLEADGLGGFASGTVCGIRTRRYHALLLAASTPPTGRQVLVNGLDVTVRTPAGEFPLSFHRYRPDVTNRTDRVSIESFTNDPWPRWVFRLSDGTRISHEVFVTKGTSRTVTAWELLDPREGVRLRVRPLLSGRDYHAMHHENHAFGFDAGSGEGWVRWTPYPDVPAITARHNGSYHEDLVWYRSFLYEQERARGFDHVEDLASPGAFEFDLTAGEAWMILCAGRVGDSHAATDSTTPTELRGMERRRRTRLGSALDRAADAYLVKREDGCTIIAGYPWFADWGRDTFIALRGLCLATGRLEEARQILLAWARSDWRGVMPNRFPDRGGVPEYNSVDASLWYIIAADEFIRECDAHRWPFAAADREVLRDTIQRILIAYADGTVHGIRMDSDGLLAAGVAGLQLTWMDARVNDRVITPRVGKPVEVQALWLNALRIGAGWAPRWTDVFERGVESFQRRFWNEADQCLFDIVDVDHVPGAIDSTCRPNQILAVGGLSQSLLSDDLAAKVVRKVEAHLVTPLGLRSLAPGHPDYSPKYAGGPEERDGAYHQGTVWPWLTAAFVDAWIRARGGTPDCRAEAKRRFVRPLLDHLETAGLGHVSEVADAEAPHTPGGCPFQAWSVGELLRLERKICGPGSPVERTPRDNRARHEAASEPPRASSRSTASARADTVIGR
ncbi:hypothetical protein PHYC_01381 [Phycisphaerales bacterium]|nr:hypothetical protein PHYC_01381 [Phycisphaerales bacterium]